MEDIKVYYDVHKADEDNIVVFYKTIKTNTYYEGYFETDDNANRMFNSLRELDVEAMKKNHYKENWDYTRPKTFRNATLWLTDNYDDITDLKYLKYKLKYLVNNAYKNFKDSNILSYYDRYYLGGELKKKKVISRMQLLWKEIEDIGIDKYMDEFTEHLFFGTLLGFVQRIGFLYALEELDKSIKIKNKEEETE